MSTAARTRPEMNPHAERVSTEEFDRLTREFYGTRTLVFDPPMAEAVLTYNTGNRRISKRKLAILAGQMAAGDFANTGEPIIMSANGVLNDGQHRLLAVMESGATVDLDVRFGIPRHVFAKTDTGASRNAADVLTIKGVAHGGQISSAVRLLILYRRGLPDSIREFVAPDHVARAYDRWSGIVDIAAQIQKMGFPAAIRTAPLYATSYLASRSPAKDRLPIWLEGLATGADIGRSDPVYQLRERLMRGADAPVGTREALMERFALMIKSWNLFSTGRVVPQREFRWRQTGRGAEPFPVLDGGRLPTVEGVG
jgi:hypothetical protein